MWQKKNRWLLNTDCDEIKRCLSATLSELCHPSVPISDTLIHHFVSILVIWNELRTLANFDSFHFGPHHTAQSICRTNSVFSKDARSNLVLVALIVASLIISTLGESKTWFSCLPFLRLPIIQSTSSKPFVSFPSTSVSFHTQIIYISFIITS